MALATSEQRLSDEQVSEQSRPEPPASDAPPAPEPAESAEFAPSRFRLLWLAIGWFFFALGFLGIFLVLLPTTGFWILAAIAFERSNPKIAQRIRNWPHFGPTVSAFLDHGVISRSGKIAALSAMAVSAALIALFTEGVALWGGLGGVAIGAAYVASRPSRPRGAKRGADSSIERERAAEE